MAKRRSLDIPGTSHGQPIPMGAKVGNMLFSSRILGQDPATGQYPPDAAQQAELVFQHMRTLLAQAGGTTDDIAYVRVYLKDPAYREHVNREWLKMFPDEHSRPARHAVPDPSGPGPLISCEIIAVIG